MCKFDCQCVICDMERQEALEMTCLSEEKKEPEPEPFEKFVKAGLGS